MDIEALIDKLYDKDTSKAFEDLKELELLSDNSNILYPYLGKFVEMVNSEKYVIRVRGFRLFCKQAKWDTENIINKCIDSVLVLLDDEKPTAIRQAIQYLEYIVPHKKELNGKIEASVLSIDCLKFKDTMRPLIEKDIQRLLRLININEDRIKQV